MYNSEELVKPPVFHYDRTHYYHEREIESFLDYHFSILNIQVKNYQFYTFPHKIVGYDGIGRAWQYLYKNSSKYKNLAGDDYIYLNKDNNADIMGELIKEQRTKFR